MDNTALKNASAILQEAKDAALAELNEAKLGTTVKSGMERIINRLNFVTGHTTATPTQVEFPPITEMFGKKIETPKKVEAAELTPKDEERQKLIDKVNTLQENISKLDNAKILEDYVTKEDKQAIRGLAKRAGMTDFKTAELTGEYLDLIRAGLTANAEAKAAKDAQDAIDAQAGK